MGRGYTKCILALLTALAASLPVKSSGGEYHIQGRADWELWTYPSGVVVLDEDGSIGLKRYRKTINAVGNATEFEYESKDAKGLVPGGIRNAGSNLGMADRVIDGDPETWWRPSAADELGDWWLEVDLGRVVLANQVRIIFPDSAGVKPFRNFSVYVSEGSRTSLRNDIFQYTRIGATIRPNTDSVIEYELRTVDPGAATGANLVTRDTLDFAAVQYVRFVADETHADAALAEIEVWTPGDNVALGTVERGGVIEAGTNAENSAAVADGSMNYWWSVTAEKTSAGDWMMAGGWYEWDLGATFWLDRLVSIEYPQYFGVSGAGNSKQYGFAFYTTDGSTLSGLAGERIESNYDYQLLTEVENLKEPRRLKFDLQFSPRKVRSIFYHVIPSIQASGDPRNLFFKLFEHVLYGEGYPAGVEMTSDYLDLGGVKNITSVDWSADAPPGTRVEIRSRTGDTFEIEVHYYTKAGKEITIDLWNKLPKSQKLTPVEIRQPGSDWSGWSRAYAHSGEAFLSPSPRNYVQLQVQLFSDDPEAAARLRAISFQYDEPLFKEGVTGRILPREAPFDSLQSFSYLLRPGISAGDTGFDQILISVPGPVEEVKVRIGEQEVEPAGVEMSGDSLKVELPQLVRRDSVEVRFQSRLVETTTQFNAWVVHSRTGVRQGIKPADLKATTVYVPAVAALGGLLRHLEITPSLITPNDDGVNDRMAVRLVVAKVLNDPEVEIFTLGGQRLRVLHLLDEGYGWDGRDEADDRVPPGVYICRIRVPADAGDETVYRIISVAY